MRIVLVGPVYPYRGGIAHYTTMLYRALRERGHEVLLVSFKRQYPQWLFPGKSDKDPSNSVLEIRDAKYWIDSLNPVTWVQTAIRIVRFDGDIVLFQWWSTFWSLVWLVMGIWIDLFGTTSVAYICHNILPHEFKSWDSILAKMVLAKGVFFIVQSEQQKRELHKMLPLAASYVVSHPVYDMFATDRLEKSIARQRLNISADAPVLLFFGIVRKYKGLDVLLQSLVVIKEYCEDVILLIAGEFWDAKSGYVDLIDSLNLQDSVILVDHYIPNEDVPLYFSATDVVVAPYIRGTGSGVVQLASGMGIPVITTLETEYQSLRGRKQHVVLVTAGDSEDLAESIIDFFANQVKWPMYSSSVDKQEGSSSSWKGLVRTIEQAVGGNNVCREISINSDNE